MWAKTFLQPSIFENTKLKNFSFKLVPSKNIRSEKFLTKPLLKLQLRYYKQNTSSKKLQINVTIYGFKILINPGNHLPNSVKYSTPEEYFIKLENWKKFITSSSNVAISLVCSICRKNRKISNLLLAKIPWFLSKSQRQTYCKMWKL